MKNVPEEKGADDRADDDSPASHARRAIDDVIAAAGLLVIEREGMLDRHAVVERLAAAHGSLLMIVDALAGARS